MASLDHKDPRAIVALQEDLASVDFLDLLDRKEIPELMVSPARLEITANEACLANPAQVDPPASEELQVPKDHAVLLAEKARKEAKAPLVSVATLARMELAC